MKTNKLEKRELYTAIRRGEVSPLAPALRSSATPLSGGSTPATPPPGGLEPPGPPINNVRSKRSQLATRTFFAILPLLAILSGCGGPGVPIQRNSAGTKSVTLSDTGSQDLEAADAVVEKNAVDKAEEPVFEIKEKMFIAQTNDVYLNPEDYMGRTIKLEGIFKSYAIEEYGAAYCFVVRYGPGCCGNDGNAGFEVAWDGTSETPYPEEDAWVEATGVLKSYDEDGYPYLYLSLSSLDVKEYRGTEFVSQ